MITDWTQVLLTRQILFPLHLRQENYLYIYQRMSRANSSSPSSGTCPESHSAVTSSSTTAENSLSRMIDAEGLASNDEVSTITSYCYISPPRVFLGGKVPANSAASTCSVTTNTVTDDFPGSGSTFSFTHGFGSSDYSNAPNYTLAPVSPQGTASLFSSGSESESEDGESRSTFRFKLPTNTSHSSSSSHLSSFSSSPLSSPSSSSSSSGEDNNALKRKRTRASFQQIVNSLKKDDKRRKISDNTNYEPEHQATPLNELKNYSPVNKKYKKKLTAKKSPKGDNTNKTFNNGKPVFRRKARLPRSKNGCWTCRCRRKKCDEAKPSCQTCFSLGIECAGYSSERPEFMWDAHASTEYRAQISRTIRARKTANNKKGNNK